MKFKFIVERTRTGFSAYEQKNPIFTTGASILELQMNALEAANLYLEKMKVSELLGQIWNLRKILGNSLTSIK